ncbi:MAG TPA: hypothetical protein VK463_18675 [Desulfomonilaceae bacterium]|nr:hypothetical protein [Desulfomonilaceae bacterium]
MIYKPSFWSRVPGVTLVLGVLSMFSIWIPSQAHPEPIIFSDKFPAADVVEKIDLLKQGGWKVQSSTNGDKTTVVATRTDPKTGRTTQANYQFREGAQEYSWSQETTDKFGRKTSEQHVTADQILSNDGSNVLRPGHDRVVSRSNTDPSTGIKTTTTYDDKGNWNKVSKYNPRFNETTDLFPDKTQTIHSASGKASSTTTTYPGGQFKTQVTHGEDGTVYTFNYDQNGKIASSKIQKPNGGPTEEITANPDGSSIHVTKSSDGKIVGTQSCDKIGNCVDVKGNQQLKPTLGQDKSQIQPFSKTNTNNKDQNAKQNTKILGNPQSANHDNKTKFNGQDYRKTHTETFARDEMTPGKWQSKTRDNSQNKASQKTDQWSSSAGSSNHLKRSRR